jgi:hypothetical protein
VMASEAQRKQWRDATRRYRLTHKRAPSRRHQINRLRAIWNNMKARCHNPKWINYARYGGRGITVCDEWLRSFEQFYADMGDRPTPEHSIDRIDNNKGYSKENCRWATRLEQRRNQRRYVLIAFNGETLPIKEWAARLGLHRLAMAARLRKWDVERALTQPRRNYPAKQAKKAPR